MRIGHKDGAEDAGLLMGEVPWSLGQCLPKGRQVWEGWKSQRRSEQNWIWACTGGEQRQGLCCQVRNLFEELLSGCFKGKFPCL